VKITSKKLGGGKYYCKAGWIIDVLSRGKCTVKLENTNILLEGIKQEDLETIVPQVRSSVLVVRGEHKGGKGVLLERDSQNIRLVLQLEEDFEIVTLQMDDAAQFREHF